MFASLAGVLFDGFAFGMLLFLLSVGLSVTLGMMNFVNLAHCSFAMIGGYATVSLANRYGWPFLATLPAAFVAAGGVAIALERTLFRRLYRASDLDQCLLTIGMVFISIAAYAFFYGTVVQSTPMPSYLKGSVQLFGMSFAAYRLFLIAMGLVVAATLVFALETTRFGAQVRAAVDNQRMARGLGIDVDRAFMITFALGGGLAGLGGALAIEIVGLDHAFALNYLVYVLIVVAVGGLGSIGGSFAAAVVLGVSDMAGKYYFPWLGAFVIYLVMVALLMWRPVGLLGKRQPQAARSAVLACHAAAVRPDSELPLPREPDCDHCALRAVAGSHPGLCRHRLARARRVLRRRRLHRGAHRQILLERAAQRLADRKHRCRPSRLRAEPHRRALSPPRAHHADPRPRAAGARSGEQRWRIHRGRGRAAGLSRARGPRVRVRPLRDHRLCLCAARLVPVLPGLQANHSLTLRPRPARHPRERDAHAGDRRAHARASAQGLHHRRGAGGNCRRAAYAYHLDGLARDAVVRPLGGRAGDPDPRRRGAPLWRHRRRHHLHGGARPVLRHEPAVLVLLDRPAARRRSDVPSQRHPWGTRKILSAQKLSKRFGSLVVAQDVELELPQGVRHALIGPNGAGKTTLINLMTGMLAPDAGQILLGGEDITGLRPEARVRRGLVRTFQINTLFPQLTALESVALTVLEREGHAHNWWRGLTRFGAEVEEAASILQSLRLQKILNRSTRELAYGEQRLLEIALALATRPRVLLLDEPAAGVPKDESAELFAAIAGLSSSLTVLFIEHDMDVVFRFASRIHVMVGGRILVQGTPDDIARDPRVREVYLGRAHRVPA